MSTPTDPRDTSAPRLYLAEYPGRVYHLDGLDEEEPDWGYLHLTLSRIHRFGGRSPLTVLHHAIAMYMLFEDTDPATRCYAFIHDHHEALVGDVPYPIKRALGGAFEAIEAPAERYIQKWFALEAALVDVVKPIDVSLTFVEAIYTGIATWSDPWIVESGFTRFSYDQLVWAVRGCTWITAQAACAEADRILSRCKRKVPR